MGIWKYDLDLSGSKKRTTMSDMLGISDIAKRLKIDEANVRRLIARESGTLKIEIHRGKGLKKLFTREDAEKLIARYEAKRGGNALIDDEESEYKYDRDGFFYLIQLIPEALPTRIKIGYADSVERRLGEHRTAAPTAKVIKTWPCKRSWDFAAMDSITREGCLLVLNEVYEGDPQGFIERGNNFFSIMPDPKSEKELSKNSPLYESEEEAQE
jgi:hypothetical protein